MDEERQDALGKFDLILAVNLKHVSECQTFEEVISRSLLFPKDEEKSVDDLLCYIRANQDKVCLMATTNTAPVAKQRKIWQQKQLSDF